MALGLKAPTLRQVLKLPKRTDERKFTLASENLEGMDLEELYHRWTTESCRCWKHGILSVRYYY